MEEIGHPQLLQKIGPVVAGAAVHRQAHGHPQLQHLRNPAHAGGELHIGNGAVGHAGTGVRQQPQLLVVEVDAMGVPHVRAHPAQILHVGQGPLAVLLQDVALLVLGLAEVGVKPDPQIPGQQGGLAQQLRRDAEGGAGGQGHRPHGVEGGIVVLLHRRLAVPQNLVHRLDHAVRRQAAVLFAQVHAAPGGGHPHPQVPGGGELGPQQVPGSAGKDVVVVKDGGASGFQQLAHAHDGAVVNRLAVQILPNLVQRPQPVKELHILHLGQIPAEGLVEMMVGVDEPRINNTSGGVQGLVRLPLFRAHISDEAVLEQEVCVFQHGIGAVAGDNGGSAANQKTAHSKSSQARGSRVIMLPRANKKTTSPGDVPDL